MSDSAMWRGKPQTVNRKTVGKSEPSSLSPPKHREAASDSRRSTIPGRPMVIGGVVPRDSTGNFGSIAKVDHLDVLVGNSCRSPPASMVTRSASQDTRLSRVSRMTPASSRDSLRSAVTHTTDDTPNDFRGKSSVALQAPYPVAFLGEIQLALSYDVITACLSVHIVQCRSLPHFGNHKPNPYVKVLLVPCQANLPVLRNKTNARKSDFNPIFDQTLQFPRITKSEVDEYRMQVSVWHKDLISQNSLIGELTITLRDYNWANPSPLWYRLEAKTVGKCLCDVDALTNQSPWKMMKASVRVRLTFSLLDRERRIGPLSLLVRDVHFYEARQVQVVHRHATLVASA
uniref:C2 domain-containing protein n=1 Tax=Angiostrongylus cantonensis TaxID=6313 RepID=A0A0K0D9P6_ANGCA